MPGPTSVFFSLLRGGEAARELGRVLRGGSMLSSRFDGYDVSGDACICECENVSESTLAMLRKNEDIKNVEDS